MHRAHDVKLIRDRIDIFYVDIDNTDALTELTLILFPSFLFENKISHGRNRSEDHIGFALPSMHDVFSTGWR